MSQGGTTRLCCRGFTRPCGMDAYNVIDHEIETFYGE